MEVRKMNSKLINAFLAIPDSTEPNINWQVLSNNLLENHSEKELIYLTGMAVTSMRRMIKGNGTEPPFRIGLKLLNMHYDEFPDKHNLMTLGV
ncbi:MAG: hypothetical protein DRQ78_11960 [Epsilonproteobacteria bacterium]|nr:MAG: hypothetical protein DRQ78_11960 [Campylobacterota bacterium]